MKPTVALISQAHLIAMLEHAIQNTTDLGRALAWLRTADRKLDAGDYGLAYAYALDTLATVGDEPSTDDLFAVLDDTAAMWLKQEVESHVDRAPYDPLPGGAE
jgi:hypothetical protein